MSESNKPFVLDVPDLHDSQIAASAEELRQGYAKACPCPRFGPVKPQHYIWDYLNERDKLDLDLETSLGATEGGHLIAGMMVVEDDRSIIRVDQYVASTPMLPFTLGHEIGHWFLHKEAVVKARECGVPPQTITLKRDLSDTSSRVERQANRFATHLLMPAHLVRDEFKKRFGSRTFSFQEVKHSRSYKDKREYAKFLATKGQHASMRPLYTEFGTSQISLAIRLEELALVTD